jgi:kumamolisin
VPDELVELEGSHRAPVEGAERVGDVASGEEITVTVFVRRDPGAHPVADPRTEAGKRPQDRRYLSPSDLQTSFGAAPADLQAVVDYAESTGLQASAASAARRSVRVTGPAGELGAAFGVELGYVRHGDVTYRGRVGPVKVPASLSGIVEAVLGFDNRPIGRSYLRAAKAGTVPLSAGAGGDAGGLPPNTYLPPQVAELYAFPAGYDGTGETVAVFVFNGDIGSGVSAPGGYDPGTSSEYFTQVLGMKAPTLIDVVVQGPGNRPGDGADPNDVSGEVYLDLCVVGSLAPGAKIAVYFTQSSEQGWVEAISQAATDTVNDPSVISISYGNPEDDPRGGWTKMAIKQVNDAFEAAAAAGRTICCAAGDSGAADEPDTTTVHADFPASSPWVLACGGTRLESAGGAICAEVVWNDLADGNGATGGGVSAIFPRPSWQSGTRAVPIAGVLPPPDGRGVPDVASLADPETPYVVVGPDGTLQEAGGTSAAAPLWSALISRFNQALGARVGYLNPLLYTDYSAALRDITGGNNGGYEAGPGWDACTGWGSPGGSSLLQAIQGPAMGQTTARIFNGATAPQTGGREMTGQQSMMNRLLTFAVLERLFDDRGGTGFEDVLPLLLVGNMTAAGNIRPTGEPPSATIPAGNGWDINGPLLLFLLLSLPGRRRRARGAAASSAARAGTTPSTAQRQLKPPGPRGRKPQKRSRTAHTPELSLSDQAASQAEFIVQNFQQSDYQFTEHIDVDRGIYDCDCNGFAGFVLERAAPDHYAMIPKEPNQFRPRAFKYYEFFSSLTPESAGGWHRIDFLRDARRGDVIAWRFPEIEKDHNTGHVLFVTEAPIADDDSGIFSVRVYDSAAQPHFDDTRGNGDGEFKTGVGSGFIKFQVDDAGRPTAFQFAPSEGFRAFPIAIGRLEPLTRPDPS